MFNLHSEDELRCLDVYTQIYLPSEASVCLFMYYVLIKRMIILCCFCLEVPGTKRLSVVLELVIATSVHNIKDNSVLSKAKHTKRSKDHWALTKKKVQIDSIMYVYSEIRNISMNITHIWTKKLKRNR